MKRTIYLLFAAILAFGVSVRGDIKEKRRGKYLRTEIRKTDKKDSYSVELLESPNGMPVLFFKKFTILTHHEVRIYEMLLEIVHENAGKGITERGAVDYVLVPDEFYEGEESLRDVIGDETPFAENDFEAKFGNTVWNIQTDKDGKYIDSSQRILEVFDNLRVKNEELVVKHSELGNRSLVISRNLLKRENANLPDRDEKDPSDILQAFGLDYTQLRISSADGLRASVKAPAKARPGEAIALTVEVQNVAGDGQNVEGKSICNLMGRSFASDSSLNGKMFYFGSIKPGKTASFTRIVKMPESKGRTCYVSIGFWTILGTAKRNECRFSIEIDDNAQ